MAVVGRRSVTRASPLRLTADTVRPMVQLDPVAVGVVEKELERTVRPGRGAFHCGHALCGQLRLRGVRVVHEQSEMVMPPPRRLQQRIRDEVKLLAAEREPGARKVERRARNRRQAQHVPIEPDRRVQVTDMQRNVVKLANLDSHRSSDSLEVLPAYSTVAAQLPAPENLKT